MTLDSKLVTAVIVFLLTLYPGICLGYFVFHRFFIIHPSRAITQTPADLDLAYEEIYFPAADRVRLHGWFIPGLASSQLKINGARPVILFFPGNEGTVSKFLPQMQPLHQAGFDIFMFGYRGFGQSAFRWPSESGVRQDARGAWRYLTRERGLAPQQIVFYAQSLGCGLAAWAAAELKPAALILEGGFTSVADITAQVVPWLPIRLLTTQRFDTRKHLGRVTCPVLIAHSVEDEPVPFAQAEKLLDAARHPKALLALRGEHARGLDFMSEEYVAAMIRFLEQHAEP